MRFGVCTWIFGDSPLEAVAARLAAIGYDGVELFGDPGAHPVAEVKPVLQDHGLSVLSLTPKDVDLAHPSLSARNSALDYYFHLLDYAAELGAPMVACHGAVGRIRAMARQAQEEGWFLEEVRLIAERARSLDLRVCLEVLNRYESHLLNTAKQARIFVDRVDSEALGILLDAYHMNIEEADPVAAVEMAGSKLFLFHAADSNRLGVGHGHVPFEALLAALGQQGYSGDIVIECTASGPDPFTPVKGDGWQEAAYREVAFSLEALHGLRG